MEIKQAPSTDFFTTLHTKELVILHGTAGGSEVGAMATLDIKDKIDVPFVIGRQGQIYQRFDPKYWAYHTGTAAICRKSIGIELVWWGWLDLVNDKFLTWTKKEIPKSEVIELPEYMGKRFFHILTPEQIYSCYWLLLKLRSDIPTIQKVETHARYSKLRYDYPPGFPNIAYLQSSITSCPRDWRYT